MSSQVITCHFEKKRNWMARHVTGAQFPTPESQRGLALYQAEEKTPQLLEKDNAPDVPEGVNFYVVDCHPLMVRYGVLLSTKWHEQDQPLLLEYLSQLSLSNFAPDSNATVSLHLAMQKGKPVACGMVFSTEEENQSVVGLYDVLGKTPQYQNAMLGYLASKAGNVDLLVAG